MRTISFGSGPVAAWWAVFGAPLLAGCGSSSEGATGQVVSADVRDACEVRASWSHEGSDACVECRRLVLGLPCTCDPKAGACWRLSASMWTNTDCDRALTECVTACADGCDCLEGCYAGHATCREKAGPADACVVNECDVVCR